jgi:diadenosine tetraphosphate (Ap4A) HIT family hydrolase
MADGCVFCRVANEVLAVSPRFRALLDSYPLSPGHALIVPKRHVVSLFDLMPDEVAEAYGLLAEAANILTYRYEVDGFNVGVNDGRAAGRTVDHLHIHLIPRYVGDVADPRGGVRNILPGPSPDLWAGKEEATDGR